MKTVVTADPYITAADLRKVLDGVPDGVILIGSRGCDGRRWGVGKVSYCVREVCNKPDEHYLLVD